MMLHWLVLAGAVGADTAILGEIQHRSVVCQTVLCVLLLCPRKSSNFQQQVEREVRKIADIRAAGRVIWLEVSSVKADVLRSRSMQRSCTRKYFVTMHCRSYRLRVLLDGKIALAIVMWLDVSRAKKFGHRAGLSILWNLYGLGPTRLPNIRSACSATM